VCSFFCYLEAQNNNRRRKKGSLSNGEWVETINEARRKQECGCVRSEVSRRKEEKKQGRRGDGVGDDEGKWREMDGEWEECQGRRESERVKKRAAGNNKATAATACSNWPRYPFIHLSLPVPPSFLPLSFHCCYQRHPFPIDAINNNSNTTYSMPL
jgi:hypothetical protein